jgi:hypothetical protein
MTSADSATLVGAGVVTVMLFPQIATVIASRNAVDPQPLDADDITPA